MREHEPLLEGVEARAWCLPGHETYWRRAAADNGCLRRRGLGPPEGDESAGAHVKGTGVKRDRSTQDSGKGGVRQGRRRKKEERAHQKEGWKRGTTGKMHAAMIEGESAGGKRHREYR